MRKLCPHHLGQARGELPALGSGPPSTAPQAFMAEHHDPNRHARWAKRRKKPFFPPRGRRWPRWWGKGCRRCGTPTKTGSPGKGLCVETASSGNRATGNRSPRAQAPLWPLGIVGPDSTSSMRYGCCGDGKRIHRSREHAGGLRCSSAEQPPGDQVLFQAAAGTQNCRRGFVGLLLAFIDFGHDGNRSRDRFALVLPFGGRGPRSHGPSPVGRRRQPIGSASPVWGKNGTVRRALGPRDGEKKPASLPGGATQAFLPFLRIHMLAPAWPVHGLLGIWEGIHGANGGTSTSGRGTIPHQNRERGRFWASPWVRGPWPRPWGKGPRPGGIPSASANFRLGAGPPQ